MSKFKKVDHFRLNPFIGGDRINMKGKFSSMWRVVIALVLVASLSLVVAVPVAASPDVSNVHVELSAYTDAATDVTYYVYFTPGVELVKNVDTITVFFPTDTTGITSDAARVDRDADGVLYANSTVSSKTVAGLRFTVTTPVKLEAGTEVRVEIDGITNPDITTTLKNYTLKVYTSRETTWVDSSAYTIGPTSVSSVTFNPATSDVAADGTAGAADDYLVTFVSTTALTSAWDTISVVFPDGVTLPSAIAAAYVTVYSDDAAWTACTVNPTISGQTVTLVQVQTDAIDAGDTVKVQFKAAALIFNPTLSTDANNQVTYRHAGEYVGKVSTSQDTGVQRANFTQDIDAVQPPSALGFRAIESATCPTTVAVATASSTFTIESKDQYGNLSDVSTNADVILSSSSTTGLFLGDTDGDGVLTDETWTSTSPVTRILQSGSTDVSATLQYKDSAAGTATITISYGNWTSATWDIDVVAKAVELWDSGTLIGTYGTIAAAEADAGTYNTIKVGPGTYQFSSTLSIDVDHLTLESTDGAASTIIDASLCTSGAAITVVTGTDYVTIDGFTIDNCPGKGIWVIYNTTGNTVKNNIITDADNGGICLVYDATYPTYVVTGATVSGNVIKDSVGSGVDLQGCAKNCTISDNTITNLTGRGICLTAGTTADSTDGNKITGNTITGSGDRGIYVKRGAGGADQALLDTNVIERNTISGGAFYGMEIGGGDDDALTVTNLVITGNVITDNVYAGIKVDSWTAASCFIKFNNITGNDTTTGYGLHNTVAVAVDAKHNWWGSTSSTAIAAMIYDSSTGTTSYDPWLGASMSAADYVISAALLDAQSTVGVKVTSSDTATAIGVAHYTSNPQETPEFTPLDFFDVYAYATTWTGDVVTIKLYPDGVTSTSKAYFWSPGESGWIECYEQGAASDHVWVKVRPYSATYPERKPVLADLVGTPFVVGTEVPAVVLESISALPSSVSLDDVGETQAITVTATYDDASTADVTATSTYVSGTPSVATVSTGGLITAVAEGSTTITVSYETKTDTVSVTVGFDPMVYDENGDGVIDKSEALTAVTGYFAGEITKAQALEVITLYFTS